MNIFSFNSNKFPKKYQSLLKSKNSTEDSRIYFALFYAKSLLVLGYFKKMTKRAKDFWKRKPPLLYEILIEITLLSSLGIITVIRVHTIVDF